MYNETVNHIFYFLYSCTVHFEDSLSIKHQQYVLFLTKVMY